VALTGTATGSGFAVSLSSNNANLTVPSSVTIASGQTSNTFTATGGLVSTNQTGVVTASAGGVTKTSTLSLMAPAQVTSVACAPSSLGSNASSTCTVTLNEAATSAATVSLASNNGLLTVPANVTVSSGQSTTTFTATSGTVSSSQSAIVTANLSGQSQHVTISLAALAQVSVLSCNPSSLSPNGTSTCVVTLNQPASGSGASIDLTSNNTNVSVSASVNANVGATKASFTATAGSFTSNSSVQITASLNGQSQAFTLTLNAAPQVQVTSVACSPATFNGGSSSTCKVTLSGAPNANGSIALSSNTANVTVSPAVAIAAGNTTAQFTAASTLVDLDTNAVVTASLGGSSKSTILTVNGIRPTSLTCTPLALNAGSSTKCTVQLNRAPQTKAIILVVTSSSAAIQAPQTLPTKTQQTQYSFTAKAATFAPPGAVLLSVAYLTLVASTNVTVLSVAAPVLAAPAKMTTTVDTPVTVTAQAEDPSGLNVNLSATNLPVGASFTVDNGSTSPSATPGVSGVIQWVPQANQVGTYSVNLRAKSAAGTTSQKVTIQVTAQVPQINTVVNAASLSTPRVCSPGSLAIIQGTALQIPSGSSGDPADRTSVTVNGDPAEVRDASATQITFRCPTNSSNQKLTLLVSNRFGVSNAANVTVQDTAPGIFTLDGSGTGQGVILVNGTSSLAALPDPDFAGQAATPGDALTLLMTGLPEGLTATSAAQVTIGQITAEVLSVADVPKSPGVQMLTVRVPQSVPVGDSIPVQVLSQTTNAKSNTVTIAIELPE
jgi:uncharacterized protein (TIGR03437 family)